MNFGSFVNAMAPEVLAMIAAAAVATAVVLAGMLAVGRLRRWGKRRRMSLRMERAVAGEERAAGLLEERGYEVLGAQAVIEHAVRIDERVVTVALRADYLAAKDGRRYVVEVKTGAVAPKIETSATRRQMLEYRIAFDVDGVLLVDAESGKVHEVTFPALERFAGPRGTTAGVMRWAVIAAVAVAVIVAVVRAE